MMSSVVPLLLLCVPIMGQTPPLLNATVGGSVLIPCSLPVSPMRLIWMYWQEEESESHLLHWNKNSPQPITNKYKNRCRAFETQFRFGNMSIILDNVTVDEDQKTFWTYVSYYDEQTKNTQKCEHCCKCKLQVSAPYQDLEVTLNGTANCATCTAHGGYPQPQVSWTGLDKSSAAKLDLQAAETSLLQDPTNKTFSVTSSVGVEGLKEVTCHIYNPHSHESTDGTATIPGDNHLFLAIGIVVGIVLTIAAAAVFYVRYRRGGRQENQVLYGRPPPAQ
ncbi:ICOS ligand-like [Chaetodon trifascialis]|uniref:ICOS ligand-like n=1 Tax=Chaetodon trifascialis TaxID=109706 RepID=UPI003995373A